MTEYYRNKDTKIYETFRYHYVSLIRQLITSCKNRANSVKCRRKSGKGEEESGRSEVISFCGAE